MQESRDPTIAFLESLEASERELGLPARFLIDLAAETDWSFVIKAHALIEAVVTNLLSHTTDVRLRPVFARLELSAKDTGKVAFAEALEFLTSRERRFIRMFSELRNDLVHDICQASFQFPSYLAEFDTNQRRSFQEAVLYFIEPGDILEGLKSFVVDQPKVALWIATMNFVGRRVTQAVHAQARAALRDAATRMPDSLLALFQQRG